MKRIGGLLTLLLVYNSLPAQLHTAREISFTNETTLLYADLLIPKHPRPGMIGIALVQGSGCNDRHNAWSRSLAMHLADSGYYVLLPDKRGCGKSGGDWKTSSFSILAGDALASAKALKKELKLETVGLAGLSQGGFIVPIAAATDSSISFVINIVGAAVSLEEQIIHEMANTARKEGLSPEDITQVLALHVLMKEYAVRGNWEKLENRFNELKKSSWAGFAATFPQHPDHWIWAWVRLNLDFDPIRYWPSVRQDVFIAYGARDQDDNMPVYESIYRLQKAFAAIGKTNYMIRLYAAGHALYEDTRPVLRKEFLDDLVGWLSAR